MNAAHARGSWTKLMVVGMMLKSTLVDTVVDSMCGLGEVMIAVVRVLGVRGLNAAAPCVLERIAIPAASISPAPREKLLIKCMKAILVAAHMVLKEFPRRAESALVWMLPRRRRRLREETHEADAMARSWGRVADQCGCAPPPPRVAVPASPGMGGRTERRWRNWQGDEHWGRRDAWPSDDKGAQRGNCVAVTEPDGDQRGPCETGGLRRWN